MNNSISSYPVILFFILTLILSTSVWIWLIPSVQTYFHFQVSENIFWLGECAPGLSAILITWILKGKPGLITLLKPVLYWRAKPIYYFIIIVVLACFYLAAIGLSVLLGAHPPTFLVRYHQITTPLFNFPAIWLIPELCILYIFCEELGWRGFALPKLLTKFSVFNASIIVGCMWAIFHVPLMLASSSQITFLYLIGYLFSTIIDSFLFTWVYIKTNRSLFIVGLLHALMNTYGAFSPTIISTVGQGKNGVTILLYFIILLPLIIYIYLLRQLSPTIDLPKPS